jgi:putative sigma-54 modulation protein
MRIDVKGLNVPINDELRGLVGKRFGTIAKQVPDVAALDVVLSEERNPAIKESQKAEANLVLKGVTLHARAHAADMRTAIGEVADELQRQVVRRREKVRGHRKVGTPTIRTIGVPDEA